MSPPQHIKFNRHCKAQRSPGLHVRHTTALFPCQAGQQKHSNGKFYVLNCHHGIDHKSGCALLPTHVITPILQRTILQMWLCCWENRCEQTIYEFGILCIWRISFEKLTHKSLEDCSWSPLTRGEGGVHPVQVTSLCRAIYSMHMRWSTHTHTHMSIFFSSNSFYKFGPHISPVIFSTVQASLCECRCLYKCASILCICVHIH